MGEAKRRRAQKAAGAAFDRVTGQIIGPVRFAGSLEGFLRRTAKNDEARKRGERVENQVPCNGCTACCYHNFVSVDPAKERPEDLARLDLVPQEDGGLRLRKREDGACVHLGPQGCTVYKHRPEACRMYDCRVLGAVRLSERYKSGHLTPAWEFSIRTKEELVMQLALQLAVGIYKRDHPDWDPMSAAKFAYKNVDQTIPAARRFIEKFDALSWEEKQKVAKWYQETVEAMAPEELRRAG